MRHQNALLAFSSSLLLMGCAGNPAPKNSRALEIVYDGKAPFTFETNIKKEVREQCDLNRNFSEAIVQRSQARGVKIVVGSETDGSANQRRLTAEILSATPGVAVFGNLGSVPAELGIKFTVTDANGAVIEKYKECRTNLAGFLGLQPTACNKLNKCAESMAEFIARSLENFR